ncbi:hypothetical protein RHGRI_016937 [Rhododendron griersonianum]|uniref:Uncharacterized protein n=1 Tax=Rhododendron griersonianum TaxID=479676 RepID=A0AAV6JVY5_9ERIC|nr:hypothetical protein RHGRI_016937 [Rhododendron griersonianum]
MGEEGLAMAFSKALNLKRKIACSPERDSVEKRQKRLLLRGVEVSDQSQEEEDEVREKALWNKRSLARARESRGRGRRGGRARGGMARGGNSSQQFSDRNLFDVNIRGDDESFQDGYLANMEEVTGKEEDMRMKALVAGLKQPHDQW